MAQMVELKCLFEVADKAASYYDGKVDVAEAIRWSYILAETAESFTARSARSLEQGKLILAYHHTCPCDLQTIHQQIMITDFKYIVHAPCSGLG